MHITQPLNEHLSGEGASRKSEWVLLLEGALEAFDALKQACMTTPILVFANYTKEFLLETDASKGGLGAVLSQKLVDGWYHPLAIWQQSPHSSQEKLLFHQTWVPGAKMGNYRTFQGIFALLILLGKAW